MSAKNGDGGSPASGAYQESDDSLDNLLWRNSTEEEYLKQMVGRYDIDGIVNEDDQATTSTLPGAIKAMDDIHVEENASLENGYISSSLERILRFVKRKDVQENAENSARYQTELVGSHDEDDNNTVDEMIEESEREEETNLNSILERIPTNADPTKNLRMNISEILQDEEEEGGGKSNANVSNRKTLINTMNNSFSPQSRQSREEGNDSLAGNETIGKIVTNMMDSEISTVGSQEERTLRRWTDFQPIAGSVATPMEKNSIDGENAFSKNRFVHDDTSVGSISEEIEVIVAERKKKLEDEVGAIETMTEGDEDTYINTMVSSLTFDGTFRARTLLAMGAMPSGQEKLSTTTSTSKMEREYDDEDVEGGKIQPWWLKAEMHPKTPVKASDETPSPGSSVAKSKEAPDTPSTVIILGMASPTYSEEVQSDFEDNRKSSKSKKPNDNKRFLNWGPSVFLKSVSNCHLWVIVGSVMLLVLSMILIITASAKISKSGDKSNESPPPLAPSPLQPTGGKDIIGLEPTTVDETPLDEVSSEDSASIENEDENQAETFQFNVSTEFPNLYDKLEYTQTHSPTLPFDPIEDTDDTIDQGPTEESLHSIQPNEDYIVDRSPNPVEDINEIIDLGLTDPPTLLSDPIEDTDDKIDQGPVEESLTNTPISIEDADDTVDPGQIDIDQIEDSVYSKWPNLQDATLWNTENPNFIFIYERLIKTLSERLPESLPLLGHPTSPQFRAMEWLSLNAPNIEEIKFRPLTQKYVLAVLYYTTNGDEWSNNAGWLTSEDECGWFATSASGSLCNSIGRAEEIDLRLNNLLGSLPSELVLLSDYVTRIRVNGNSLQGRVPSFLGEMTKLERFHAHWNSLSGTLPDNLGELSSKLLSLRLGKNLLTGTIPWQLRNLELLEALDLEANEFTGTVPFFLGDLTNLEELNLRKNQLSGTIPLEFMKFEHLTSLKLERNNLTGSMPEEVCNTLPFLEVVTVDCEEVYCWCCDGCSNNATTPAATATGDPS